MTRASFNPSGSRIPRPYDTCDVRALPINPQEAFLLSRIDGSTSEHDLVLLTGFDPTKVQCILDRLHGLGAITWVGEPTDEARRPVAQPPRVQAPPQRPSGIHDRADLDEATKQDILATWAVIGQRNYYELLGVTQSTERKELRKSYHARAPAYHPDRYFGKDLGPFKQKMEAIFSRLTLAYETLSDPKRRAEYDAYLAAQREAEALEQLLSGGPDSPSPLPAPAPTSPPEGRVPSQPVSSGRILKAPCAPRITECPDSGRGGSITPAAASGVPPSPSAARCSEPVARATASPVDAWRPTTQQPPAVAGRPTTQQPPAVAGRSTTQQPPAISGRPTTQQPPAVAGRSPTQPPAIAASSDLTAQTVSARAPAGAMVGTARTSLPAPAGTLPSPVPPTAVHMSSAPSRSTDPERARREALARKLGIGRGTLPPDARVSTGPPPRSRPDPELQAQELQRRREATEAQRSTLRKHVETARAYAAAGNAAAAANEYRLALAIDPHDVALLRAQEEATRLASKQLAEAYLRQGDYEAQNRNWAEAARSYDRAASTMHDNPEVLERAAAAILKAGGDPLRAAEHARRALALAPHRVEPHLILAEVHIGAGRTLLAKRALDAARELCPDDDRLNEFAKKLK